MPTSPTPSPPRHELRRLRVEHRARRSRRRDPAATVQAASQHQVTGDIQNQSRSTGGRLRCGFGTKHWPREGTGAARRAGRHTQGRLRARQPLV